MKVVTWNVNSVNTRLEHLLHLLENVKPDVVCLQEIKCEDSRFPFDSISNCGYSSVVSGMKSYNGVALLSQHKMEDIKLSFPHENITKHNEEYSQEPRKNLESRYIEATICIKDGAVRVASIYVPNGGVSAKESIAKSNMLVLNKFTQKHAINKIKPCL